MSDGKGTQYERTRASILKELFYEFEDGAFSRVGFEKILDSMASVTIGPCEVLEEAQ